jgi:N-acetylmuramoyl-L-alanine amidase
MTVFSGTTRTSGVFSIFAAVVCFLLFTSFNPHHPAVYRVRTVVIDAGHGGKDPGCHGVKYHEKDVALSVALKLGKYIEDHFQDVKVVYTRKTDVFVELGERANIANDNNADLFICIHCNANPNKEAKGSETYVMGLHKTRGNLEVAKRENSSILMEDDYKKKYDGFDPNSDEANIVFSMYQNVHLEHSLSLAAKIQEQYTKYAGRIDKGVKQAGFLVLWRTAMPALLTETGFLSNPEEEKFLGSTQGQDYLAKCLFKAFRSYKFEVEGKPYKMNDDFETMKPYKDSTGEPVTEEPKEPKVIKNDPVVKDAASADIGKTGMVDERALYPANHKGNEEGSSEPKNTAVNTAEPVVFRVQILSSDKKIPLTSGQFKGFGKVREHVNGDVFKYTVGEESSFSSAVKLQSQAREKYPEAFIVAYRNGERISVSEALKQTGKN